MNDLFVYYKVRDEHAAALLPRVTAMQAGLAARHGVAPQLKRRPQDVDGWQTWMEVYPGAAGVGATGAGATGAGATGAGATGAGATGAGAAGAGATSERAVGNGTASADTAGEGVGGDFETILAAAVRQAGLAALAETRHTEVFMDLISCA